MMHIPTYYKRRGWQRFFAGVIAGAIIAYGLLLYVSGSLLEHWVEENIRLRGKLTELESAYEGLLNTQEEEEKQFTVQQIEIAFTNDKRLQLDRLTKHQLETLIKHEIENVIGKNVEEIGKNRDLLIKAIENKRFRIDDFTYQVEVVQLIIYTQLSFELSISIDT
ncbi:sporulation membrane protein YtrI [Thalassobacillus devorans]|uniref:sporulation membrane protein YtrI n=1 Tax=Thalassobacillus devorans TaxID=279813 RepID=UPI000685E647|nr:sporulation membrane protein YtrI [Thalassobacillus devorans]